MLFLVISTPAMTMRGGTGEMRAWLTVAGAMEEMGSRARAVEYIPPPHAVIHSPF